MVPSWSDDRSFRAIILERLVSFPLRCQMGCGTPFRPGVFDQFSSLFFLVDYVHTAPVTSISLQSGALLTLRNAFISLCLMGTAGQAVMSAGTARCTVILLLHLNSERSSILLELCVPCPQGQPGKPLSHTMGITARFQQQRHPLGRMAGAEQPLGLCRGSPWAHAVHHG